MVYKVLAIGDTGNLMLTLSKFVKKSKIYLVNFPKDGAGEYTYGQGSELFKSWKVKEQVKRINEIKDKFDICITMGTGERIAYLADLNYISYYVGRDIDAPRFVKNSHEQWFSEPLHKLNIFERKFYHDVFNNAVAHVAGTWVFTHLEKYTKNGIRLDRVPIDHTVFNNNINGFAKERKKFTFLCPQRIDISKGTELIWKALDLCKSDFEVLQVEWFGEATNEEKEIKKKLLENIPSQIKFIPMIKREDMPKFYASSDAVLGNMKIGTHALIEFEAVFCNKPVIQYSDPKMAVIINGNEIKSPFLPHSNDPKKIAEIIDRVVESKEFRDDLFQKESKFVNEVGDPIKCADWWDNFFEEQARKHESIKKKSTRIQVKLRMLFFLFANRLYFNKIKRKITNHFK